MSQLKKISEKRCLAYQQRNLSNFLELCLQYHFILDELGKKRKADIISEEHQDLFNLARRCGAVYKPSGAGGGDLGIIMIDSSEVAEKVFMEILHSSFQNVNLQFIWKGVSVQTT